MVDICSLAIVQLGPRKRTKAYGSTVSLRAAMGRFARLFRFRRRSGLAAFLD